MSRGQLLRMWALFGLFALVVAGGALWTRKRLISEAMQADAGAALTLALPNASEFDGGVSSVDPPATAGNLAQDIASFQSVDECVSVRGDVDAVLGDALGSLGYDTFVHDACTSLAAAKKGDSALCEGLGTNTLRRGCMRLVAVVKRDADACPLISDALYYQGRDAECVAIAKRDPRYCASVPTLVERAHCLAVAAASDEQCRGLEVGLRARCERDVARWKELVGTTVQGARFPVTPPTLRIKARVAEGKEESVYDARMPVVAERGVVVVIDAKALRVFVGHELYEVQTMVAPSPNEKPHLAFRADVGAKGVTSLERLELDVPGRASYLVPSARCDCAVKVDLPGMDTSKLAFGDAGAPTLERGSPITVQVAGKVGVPPQEFYIEASISTFVRDVVKLRTQ